MDDVSAGSLGAYMNLARLLQPTMVVIEDVDLIARDREQMGSCEEPLLNKLLNEMDGLKEDADILFVLTTNRPEQLEGALAGRPGRIDQAIEVPLPDEIGRGKLVRLYGKGLPLDQTVIGEAARRTEGVSAAFIKELMRRIAEGAIARDGGNSVISADIDEALNDMLFAGGRLNVKLLGGARARTPNPFSSQRDRLVAAAFGGFRHGFGPGARAQFAEQGFDVEFHGVQRDVEVTRDGLVGHAFRERAEHLEFARRQQGVSLGLAHRAKTSRRRIGRANDQAGGNRPQGGIDLARARIAGQHAGQVMIGATEA